MRYPSLFAVACFLLGGATSPAQDPFGASDPFAPADPAAEATAPPLPEAAVPAAPPGAPPAAAPAEKEPRPEHPLLRELRDSNPTTPRQLMRAVGIALDLNEMEAAKGYVEQLLAANLDAAALTALVREFGSGAFVRIGQTEELAPEGKQFALQALKTTDAVARDPARLAGVADKLNDPSPVVQRAAVRELQRAGEAAVAPLVRILADPARQAEHAHVRRALYYLGQPAVEPLLGTLEAPDPLLRAQAIEVLAALRAKEAADLLVGPAVDPSEDASVRNAAGAALEQIIGARPHPRDARDHLARRVIELLDGELPRNPGLDGAVELWRWDAGQGIAVPQRYPANVAGAALAARLADDLHAIDPEAKSPTLHLQALLQAAKSENRLDLPLPRGEGTAHARAATFGPEAVEAALAEALKAERIPAAIAAAEVLGDIGAPALVHSGTAYPSPLVAALSHKNQRVRLFAAEAIARLNPTSPFPNSSRYINTLARTVRTEALPRVVVGHPRGDVAQTLAGMLQQMGYNAEAAYTGRQAYELAARHPDTAFLLLSDALDDPPVAPLVDLLRQDLRTANVPIGVMYRIEIEPVIYTSDTFALMEAAAEAVEPVPGLIYREDRLLHARYVAKGDPRTEVFPEIHDAATLDFAIGRLAAIAGPDFITPRERIYFAQVALEAFARYAAAPGAYAFYEPARVQDSMIKAVDQPELSLFAVRALGMLGTARAQRSLVDVASQHARPLELRQAAAVAFREAVAREHLQLTTTEVLLQYKLYNLSEHLDRETQAVLGHVLDTLEGAGLETPASQPAHVEEPAPSP
jgi:HEAT repeat protein